MSNWRDRTERDATLSHRKINPDSINIKFHQSNDDKFIDKFWRYFFIGSSAISLLLLLISFGLFTSLFNKTTNTIDILINSKIVDRSRVIATCEKDSNGNLVTSITDIGGMNKRSFVEWNSEAICKEISIELNRQINADRESKLDAIDKSNLKEPQTSSTYQNSKQSSGSK